MGLLMICKAYMPIYMSDGLCGVVHKALVDLKIGAFLKPSADFLLRKYCKKRSLTGGW